MRSIAALPSIALIAGCACGLLAEDPFLLLTTLALAASIAVAAWGATIARPRAVALAVAVGCFAGGVRLAAVAWQHAWRPPLRIEFERQARLARAEAIGEGRRPAVDDEVFATIAGVLVSDAAPAANGVSITVDVDVSPAGSCADTERRLASSSCGAVLLTVLGSLATDRMDEWRAGRRVRLPAQLRRAARYLNPGVPDGERALARRGITLVGTVKSGALVDLVARGSPWSEALAAARRFSRRAIRGAVSRWNPQSGAIVAAIVIGDRSTLDEDVQRRLQEAGTYHVIAISGGNIAILAGLIVNAFRAFGRLGRGAMVAAIALLPAYAAFVGGGASVGRATLMAVLYFGARLFDLRTPPLNALAVAAALLAVADPLSIADPALLLTFGATLGILIIVPAFEWPRLPPPARTLAAMLSASIAAELALFPIGALLFSRVTVAGLALNFLAIPLMAMAQIAGMAVLPLASISVRLAAAAGWIAHLGAAGLVASAELVRFAPAATWRVAPPPFAAVAVYYATFVGGWISWRRIRAEGTLRSRAIMVTCRLCVIASAAAALWILTDPRTLTAPSGDGRLHATCIDVGQGDATFIVFPRGSTLLVDAGGLGFSSSFDVGERVVAPVIRSFGFRRIDRLALTHGDPDHIGGAASIVRELRPAAVWEGLPVARSDPLTALRVQARRQGAAWANVHAGDRVTIDGVEVTAMHPEREEWERQRVRNDDSLVLELRWRDVSIVLTGDIGRAPEARLASAFTPARIRVLKVPHHGSLTSSSAPFVAALKPTIAVVSAGRSNRYGHPAPEVLQRYESAGASVFRTDRDGAVSVDTDGTDLTVRTFAGLRIAG